MGGGSEGNAYFAYVVRGVGGPEVKGLYCLCKESKFLFWVFLPFLEYCKGPFLYIHFFLVLQGVHFNASKIICLWEVKDEKQNNWFKRQHQSWLPIRRWSGNNVSGHYFHHYFLFLLCPFFPVFHNYFILVSLCHLIRCWIGLCGCAPNQSEKIQFFKGPVSGFVGSIPLPTLNSGI